MPLVRYSFLTELLGFILLAGAVAWDLLLRRREESKVLGLHAAD